MYSAIVNASFAWCVQFLYDIANWMNITYESLNVWVFVVVHPLITMVLVLWVIKLRARLKRVQKIKKKDLVVVRVDPPAIQMP